MAKDKIDHLTEIVKLGFANLDTRIERGFAALAEDIGDIREKMATKDQVFALQRQVNSISGLVP